MFGSRFDFNDPDFQVVLNMSSFALNVSGPLSLGFYYPIWATWMFSRHEGRKASLRQQNLVKIKEYIMKQVKEHEESYDGNEIRDLVDLYIQVTRDSKKETKETFTKGNMYRVILEMFVAGSETTFSTLDWCFLFMAEFPEIQKKMSE